MPKLREVESGYGTSLGRTEEFTEEHANAIMEWQLRTGLKCWEPAPKNAPLSTGESSTTTEGN